jgi:multisubunit Na+/H+ antiporter MnhB subunit
VIPSLVLRTWARLLVPLTFLFSLWILWRGHNSPGGGFAGGILAATGVALYGLAYSVAEARRLLPLQPLSLIGTGLGLSVLSGFVAFWHDRTFLTGIWNTDLKLGTPLLFDIGVYLLVFGTLMQFVLTFERRIGEEPE